MLSKRLLFAFSALCAVVFLYAVVGYPRTSTASLRLQVTLLVAVPALGIIAAFAASRSSASRRAVLVGALIAGGVALLAAEPMLELAWQTRARANGPVDERDRAQVIADLGAAGVTAVPAIEPKALLRPQPDGTMRSVMSGDGAELHPVGGMSRRTTVVCNETGEWVTYESDRYGMHNPDDVWDAEAVELAVVGDAFANGWCAGPGVHFVHRIRAALPSTVNLAQSGNGPLLVLASVLEYLPSRRPRNVLWFHYELNDLQDLETERRSPLLMGYLDDGFSQDLQRRQAGIDREVGRYIETAPDDWRVLGNLQVRAPAPRLNLGGFLRTAKLTRLRQFLGLTYSDDFAPDHQLFAQVLERAQTAVESWGGTLWLVYLPAAPRYLAFRGSGGAHEAARLRVHDTAERLGIGVVDAHLVFRDHSDPLSLFNPIRGGGYGHYTAVGHEFVADRVLGALRATDRR